MSTMDAAQVAAGTSSGRSYLRALEAAVAAIYFADSADYKSALWSVVRHLSPLTAIELERDELKAFNDVKAVVDEIDQAGRCADGAARAFAPAEGHRSGALPARDTTRLAERRGQFHKFIVRRTDGSDAPGGKHHACEYFVLDVAHDKHAPAALAAYASVVEATHPALAADIRARYRIGAPAPGPSKTVPNRAAGGHARAAAMSPERRSELARAAASARWANRSKQGEQIG